MAIDTTKVKAQILRWKNNIASVYTELDKKVDKVTGKGLSTEDYTTTEKNKLSGIEAGAEVNVQSDWTQEVNTADDYIKNKPAIPTKTSDLTNDTGYITGYTETDPIFTAWDKSTGISITKSQITDLIEATQALSGLMSATDKQRLDVLHALLEEDTANNVVDSINEILAIFNNYPEGADLVSALSGKVDKNNAITAGTKTKITYDAKGLVTSGADLEESDIPPLSASKITQTTTAKFVTDAEKATWNGKQNALTAGDGISISGDVISATGGGDAYLANTQTFTGVNTFTQNVNLNGNKSSLSDPALTFNIGQNEIARIRVNPEGNPEQSPTTFRLIPTYLGDDETLLHTGNVKTINDQSILGSGNIELQKPLISGTNIKTINGNSLLGSGNITIDGGSGGTGGGDAYLANTQTFTGVNTFTQNVNLNGNKSSLSDPALTFNIGQNEIARIRVNPEGNPEQSPTTFRLIPTYLGDDETLLHTGNVKTINDQSILGSGNIELQQPLTNVTTAEIVTGTATTQKTVTAKAVHDAIMQIMFDSLGGES